MRILKKPLNYVKPSKPIKAYYYGKCANPQCKGEYEFDVIETYINHSNICALCPNCNREIKTHTELP